MAGSELSGLGASAREPVESIGSRSSGAPALLLKRKDWLLGLALLTPGAMFRLWADQLVFPRGLWDLEFLKYVNLGRELVARDWIWGEVFVNSPLTIYLVGALDQLLGGQIDRLRWLHLGLSGVVTALLYLGGLRWVGRPAALLAALASLVYGPFLLQCSVITPELWGLLCAGVLLLVIPAPGGRCSGWRWWGTGLVIGLGAAVRPSFFLILIPLALLHVRKLKSSGLSSRLRVQIPALILGFVLPVAPITLMNWQAGDFVLLTATSGNLLYANNNYASNGLGYSPPSQMQVLENRAHTDPGNRLPVEHAAFFRVARWVTGEDLTPSQANRFWAKKFLDSLVRDPGWFAGLMGRKLFYFLNDYESHDTAEMMQKQGLLRSWIFLSQGAVVPLGILGLLWGWFRRRSPVMLLFLLPSLSSCLLVSVVSRYRVQSAIPWLLLGAWSVMELIRSYRARELKKVLLGLTGVLSLTLVCEWEDASIFQHRTVDVPVNLSAMRGATLIQQGKLAEALEEFDTQVRIDPGAAVLAHLNLSRIHRALGHAPESAREAYLAKVGGPPRSEHFYQEHLREHPGDISAREALGIWYWRKKRVEEARAQFETVLRQAPLHPAGPFNLGLTWLYGSPRRPQLAVELLRESLILGMSVSHLAPTTHNHLGVALLESGRRAEAEAEFREALRLDPELEPAAINLALLQRQPELGPRGNEESRGSSELGAGSANSSTLGAEN